MPARYFTPILTISLNLIAVTFISAQPRKQFVPGRRAIVFDERLSALRAQPDVKATLEQRVRRGRRVGIIGATKGKDGASYLRVAISRNQQGWMLADAVLRPGNAQDGERLLKLLAETRDDFVKTRLARFCADEMRAAEIAARCLLILGETAERAAERLTRDAQRRVGDEEPSAGLSKRGYFLNYVGLDRYNRAGVTFDFNEAGEKIVYDGAAYRELLRRYPRSAEAKAAQERSNKLAGK
jgi:hypothetical protein